MINQKYIELLLKRCLKVEKGDSLFINYNKEIKDFAKEVKKYAEEMGISDICMNEEDLEKVHDILLNASVEDIENNEDFKCKEWDEYAKKDAAFLLLDTEIPKLMDDVPNESLAKYTYVKRTSKPIYKEKQLKSLIPWCIASVPNKKWALEIFEKSEDPMEDFWNILADMCMLNNEDPIKEWDKLLKKQEVLLEKLNNLKIKNLTFKNSLGTDITVELNNETLWQSACSNKWIVNMPSYEIFTTPDYRKTNGIVYSSRPLIYNGKTIDNFSLTFKDGKVTDINAEEGLEILKEIINGDEYSAYLGEVALVDYDSPISNTNKVFKSTLFDENASCHMALGSGFVECIKNGKNLSKEEAKEKGINPSNNHVDFMIGTEDLTVIAETAKGKVTIMEKGNIII